MRGHVERGGISARSRFGLLTALYAGLAIASTWPLATRLTTDMPRGTLDSATIPFVSSWTLWWTSDRLLAGLAEFWNAPIFHPTTGVFGALESMTLLGVAAAPLFWAGASAALVYNLVALGALISNGLVGYGLMRALRLHPLAAAAGGAMLVVLPYTHRELGVLTLVPLAGVLGTLWAIVALCRRPTRTRGAVLGGAFAATYLISSQHALFLALTAPPASLWLLRRELFGRSALIALAIALLTAAALIAPVAAGQLESLEERGFEWDPDSVVAGSASLATWRAAAWRPTMPIPGGHPPQGPHRRGHFPGTAKLALAIAAAGWGLRRAETRRVTAFAITLGLAAVWLSMLPRTDLAGLPVYRELREVVPGVAQVRAFYRAAVLGQIAVVLLAAQALHALLAWRGPTWLFGAGTRRASAAALALGALAVVDLWPTGQGIASPPAPTVWRSFTGWVDANVEPGEVMAYLPFPRGDSVAAFARDAAWMLLQTEHGRAMVNGYASVMPSSHQQFARGVAGFPDARSHRYMEAYGVRWAVVRSAWLRETGRRAPDARLWRRAFDDPKLGIAIYEVLRQVSTRARGPQGSVRPLAGSPGRSARTRRHW